MKVKIAVAIVVNCVNMLVAWATGIKFDASMEVAIAPGAGGPVQFAAEEMTNFLSRTFGKTIPIVWKLAPGKATIVLGTNAWSAAAGVDISSLRHDGYMMRTVGNVLYIAGADAGCTLEYCRTHGSYDRGTMMGTYAFLEKYAGCRFYFPGELGEIVPRRGSVSVPDLDFSDSPAFADRRYSNYLTGEWFDATLDKRTVERLKHLNCFRLRLASRAYITCHGLRTFRYGHRFKESHPEYFMLRKDGTRYLYDTEQKPYHRNCKLCFSNPELREIIYQDVKAYITKQPPQSRGLESWGGAKWDNKFVDVEPEDGWAPCQCERCKATYRNDLGGSFATDLIWGFTKEMAERLTAEGLDAVLMQESYSAWSEPPDFDLPSNIAIDVSTGGPWSVRKPDEIRAHLAMLEKWAKKLGHSVLNWTYPGKFGLLGLDSTSDIPQITPRAWSEYYKLAAPFISGDFAGTYANTCTDRFLFDALNFYVFSRVAWDPSVDAHAILDEHYRLMYGSAAKDIQSIFETLEDLWLDRICGGKTVYTNLGPKTVLPGDLEIWTRIYSPDKIGKLLSLADMASAKVASDSLEARRIALVRREMLERLDRHSREYSEKLSVEREKASRAARLPMNLVEGFKPVTITVTESMTNTPFSRVKYRLPRLKQGHRYRLSFFVRGENIVPYKNCGGAQGVIWADESMDEGGDYPRIGATGTFDWLHFQGEYAMPKKGVNKFSPEVDLRILYATGTAHFDGLLVEEVE